MHMGSWGIRRAAHTSYTWGINTLVVNTVIVANTGGEDGIVEGTDEVKNKMINRTWGAGGERQDKKQGHVRQDKSIGWWEGLKW